ncbi:hypothetical protein D3C73_893820 [compost metagenome]
MKLIDACIGFNYNEINQYLTTLEDEMRGMRQQFVANEEAFTEAQAELLHEVSKLQQQIEYVDQLEKRVKQWNHINEPY